MAEKFVKLYVKLYRSKECFNTLFTLQVSKTQYSGQKPYRTIKTWNTKRNSIVQIEKSRKQNGFSYLKEYHGKVFPDSLDNFCCLLKTETPVLNKFYIWHSKIIKESYLSSSIQHFVLLLFSGDDFFNLDLLSILKPANLPNHIFFLKSIIY